MTAEASPDTVPQDFQRTLTLHSSVMDLLVVLSGSDRSSDAFIAAVKKQLAVVVDAVNAADGGVSIPDPQSIEWRDVLSLARLSGLEGMDQYLRDVSASIYEFEKRGVWRRWSGRWSAAKPPENLAEAASVYQKFQACSEDLISLQDQVSLHTMRFTQHLKYLREALKRSEALAFALHPFNKNAQVGQARLAALELAHSLLLWRNRVIKVCGDGFGRASRKNFALLLEAYKGTIDARLEDIEQLNGEDGDLKLKFFVSLVRGICEDSIFFEAYLKAAQQCVIGGQADIEALKAVRIETGVSVSPNEERGELVLTFTRVAGEYPAEQLANGLKQAFDCAIKFGLIKVEHEPETGTETGTAAESIKIYASGLVGNQGILGMIQKANTIAETRGFQSRIESKYTDLLPT